MKDNIIYGLPYQHVTIIDRSRRDNDGRIVKSDFYRYEGNISFDEYCDNLVHFCNTGKFLD